MNRQEYNKKILEKISVEIDNFPDGRFFQILYNMNIIRGFPRGDGSLVIVDDYNRESEHIFKNIRRDE